LGVTMIENNMTEHTLTGNIPEYFQWDISSEEFVLPGEELWILVPDSVISDNVKILGFWKREGDSTGAVLLNRYDKGFSVLLASSGMLHPVNDGGFWSISQLDHFYGYVLDQYYESKSITARLNPWPSGFDYAFSISLNASGTMDQYDRIFNLLKQEEISPTLFVNGQVSEEIYKYIIASGFPLASNGYSFSQYTEMKYPQAVEDIVRNENYWNKNFDGFRFPFTRPGFFGLLALDQHDYQYESSIGANNLEFLYGSVFPYNLVIAQDGMYKTTEIMEVAPIYHDDYHFLKIISETSDPDTNMLLRNVVIYRDYLENFWKFAIKPYNGLMVYQGHPQFVGYNDSTLSALSNLIYTVKKENTWLTTLEDAANFRKGLALLQIFIEKQNTGINIHVVAPGGVIVKNTCLKFTDKIKSASAANGEVNVTDHPGGSNLVFDAMNGQTLTVEFK
jgi:hypothetical protein